MVSPTHLNGQFEPFEWSVLPLYLAILLSIVSSIKIDIHASIRHFWAPKSEQVRKPLSNEEEKCRLR